MAMTANERLQDAAVSHAVDLQQYGTGVVRRVMALLNRADADLAAALTQALERLPAGEFSVERLESLLVSVRMLNAQAYGLVGQELTAEMRRLVEYEQMKLASAKLDALPQLGRDFLRAQVHIEQSLQPRWPDVNTDDLRQAWRETDGGLSSPDRPW